MEIIGRPNPEDAPPWCPYFFGLVPESDLFDALHRNREAVLALIAAVPPGREDYRYAADKWSVRDVFLHLNDTERFYAYRAFSASRKVDISLEFAPERETYARNAPPRPLAAIAEEFQLLRDATIHLFRHMTEDTIDFCDFPGKMRYSARSLGWMTVGHATHHLRLLQDRYGLV
jgi:uncharacterized damage-inducible protein DinB